MSILETKQIWRRTPTRRRRGKLTPEASANVRKALLFLASRMTVDQLAAVLDMSRAAVIKARQPRRLPSARFAVIIAHAAGVSLVDVLSGAWPGDACPACGRNGATS